MTPQDCPFLYEGDFAQSLLNDCRDYARHIAGKFRPRPATLTNHLSSALHLEMKLSKPKAELPNRYLPNDLEYNTWKAMANRTTHMPDDEKILKEAKDEIFHRIRNVLPSTENCEAHDFDRKILTLLSELRDQGLTYLPNSAPSASLKDSSTSITNTNWPGHLPSGPPPQNRNTPPKTSTHSFPTSTPHSTSPSSKHSNPSRLDDG